MSKLTNDGYGKSILNSVLFVHATSDDTANKRLCQGSVTTPLTDTNGGAPAAPNNVLKRAVDPASPDVTLNGVGYDYTTSADVDALKGITVNQVLADMAAVESKDAKGGSNFSKYRQDEADAVVKRDLEFLVKHCLDLTGPVI